MDEKQSSFHTKNCFRLINTLQRCDIKTIVENHDQNAIQESGDRYLQAAQQHKTQRKHAGFNTTRSKHEGGL